MIVVGASSLRRTLDYLPYDLRVKYRRFTFAKSGLSLNPNNVNSRNCRGYLETVPLSPEKSLAGTT